MNNINNTDDTLTEDITTETEQKQPNKKRIVLMTVAFVSVLALVAGGISVFAYHKYTVNRDCAAQVKVFNYQKNDLEGFVRSAREELATVDASAKVGEGRRMTYTEGFILTSENQDAMHDLVKMIHLAENHTKTELPKCSDGDSLSTLKKLNETRQKDVDAAKAQITKFIKIRDEYRLATASKKANSTMEKAKSALAMIQKDAADQLTLVQNDTTLQGNTAVKAAYDSLKSVESKSHSISTTITTSTIDDAIKSIDKAKEVATSAKEIRDATQVLKDAIKAHQGAKTAETAAAQQSSASQVSHPRRNSSSSGARPRSRIHRNHTPAPAPAAPSKSKGDDSGWVDLGPGQPPSTTYGCLIMEGKKYCGCVDHKGKDIPCKN